MKSKLLFYISIVTVFDCLLSCGYCCVDYQGRLLNSKERKNHLVIYFTWSGIDDTVTIKGSPAYGELYLDSNGIYKDRACYDYFDCPQWKNCKNRQELPHQVRVKIWDQISREYVVDTIFTCSELKPIKNYSDDIIIKIPDTLLK
jgi:hypothetical protein